MGQYIITQDMILVHLLKIYVKFFTISLTKAIVYHAVCGDVNINLIQQNAIPQVGNYVNAYKS